MLPTTDYRLPTTDYRYMPESTKYRAYICCGPNCGPKGTPALLDFLEGEVEREGLARQVSVFPTGCQTHCETGPTMVVYPGPVYYQEVNRDRLRRIVSEHFLDDRPVREYFWTGPRKRPFRDAHPPVASPPQPARAHTDAQGTAPAWAAQSAKPHTEKKPRPAPEVDDFKW